MVAIMTAVVVRVACHSVVGSGCRDGGLRGRGRCNAHGHGVTQQAPQDQQQTQDHGNGVAHAANDTGAVQEVPPERAPGDGPAACRQTAM